ncbi:hypothetical protein ACO2Q3_24565 [Caulobacter sp. KR2-114]|jgi:hypothetical protein|uniref:hypothetical protein n=1 Tax=Caulobacter sp. KR2-114 TaxID=3400912 RepID=UPI003C023A7F
MAEDPEAPLSRAAVALVLGAALAGSSRSDLVARGGGLADIFLVGGLLLITGGLIATVRVLIAHWNDRAR